MASCTLRGPWSPHTAVPAWAGARASWWLTPNPSQAAPAGASRERHAGVSRAGMLHAAAALFGNAGLSAGAVKGSAAAATSWGACRGCAVPPEAASAARRSTRWSTAWARTERPQVLSDAHMDASLEWNPVSTTHIGTTCPVFI